MLLFRTNSERSRGAARHATSAVNFLKQATKRISKGIHLFLLKHHNFDWNTIKGNMIGNFAKNYVKRVKAVIV